MPLTLEKLQKIKQYLDENAIKPFNGYIGVCKEGFFEIKSQEQFDSLRENTENINDRRTDSKVDGV